MKRGTVKMLQQAALMAAFGAGMRSDEVKANVRPYVPWVIGAGVVWLLTRKGR